MANFIETSADFEHRLGDLSARLFRVESHMRRGEHRAARAQIDNLLGEFDQLAKDMELPLETVIVGAQLGFFSGGALFRGRIPGAFLGATIGWLYGQQALQKHRLFLSDLLKRVEEIYAQLQVRDTAASPVVENVQESH